MSPRPRAIDWHRIGREDCAPLRRWLLERIAEGGNVPRAAKDLHVELRDAFPGTFTLQSVSNALHALEGSGRVRVTSRTVVRGAVQAWWVVCEECLVTPEGEAAAQLQATATRLAAAGVDAAEDLARRFHETYERLAPAYGYKTREESAVPWEQVPATNKRLMTAVCRQLLLEFEIEDEIRAAAELRDA